jgi:hypothetical protein
MSLVLVNPNTDWGRDKGKETCRKREPAVIHLFVSLRLLSLPDLKRKVKEKPQIPNKPGITGNSRNYRNYLERIWGDKGLKPLEGKGLRR